MILAGCGTDKGENYSNMADLFQSVQKGKIDGFLAGEPNFNSVKRVSNELLALKVPELNVEIGYGFQKNKHFRIRDCS